MNEGTIQNVKINGTIVSTGNFVGGIVGVNKNKIVSCTNNTYVQGNEYVGGIIGNMPSQGALVERCSNLAEVYGIIGNVGGIVGVCQGIVKESYNIAYIHAGGGTAGGICGYNIKGPLYNCYNVGKIEAPICIGGINGAAGHPSFAIVYSYNCYNIGNIIGGSDIGTITGYINANGGGSSDVNCYSTDVTVDALNAGEYSNNVWVKDTKINEGYPILRWQKD